MRMTTDEIKLITFIVFAVLAGSSAKCYRSKHPRPMVGTPVPHTPLLGPSSRRW